jgi:adenosylcobinamide-phosphate synthase
MAVDLGCGCALETSDTRAAISLAPEESWLVLSSAVLNGGTRTLPPGAHVLNSTVHPEYDGVSPEPAALLARLAEQEGWLSESCVGLLTAASMRTLRIASRSADGVTITAIVTAGISNALAAGDDADYFVLREALAAKAPPPGTINTIVLTDAQLTPGALVEAHALAVESKCAACFDLGIASAKSGRPAQGTGTDCTVLCSQVGGTPVRHAGKHVLFAELLGQAVREATHAALSANLQCLHGSHARYTLRRWALAARSALSGARPCVPPMPMMPMPALPISVALTGVLAVAAAYAASAPREACVASPPVAGVLLAAVAWDRFLGEPPLSVHPVMLLGHTISAAVRRTPERVLASPPLGLAAGGALVAGMLCATGALVAILVAGARAAAEALAGGAWGTAARFAAFAFEAVLLKSALSLQLLCNVPARMSQLLERNQMAAARTQLSWLCSRDPAALDGEQLIGATLESLAENLSDGFVAPLVWYLIGGPAGALVYRAANTLDSRIGYRGKFEWFGKVAARLDDVLNLVPARLTALLIVAAAAAVPGCDWRLGLRVAWRDCSRCASPNAGWPMGAMAGLLGVQLEKVGEYRLGDATRALEPRSIRTGCKVAHLAGGLAVALACVAIAVAPRFSYA